MESGAETESSSRKSQTIEAMPSAGSLESGKAEGQQFANQNVEADLVAAEQKPTSQAVTTINDESGKVERGVRGATEAAEASAKVDKSVCHEGRTIPNTVKDENGFVYYKCRFCGLTFNFMTTLKAHERVHDVAQPFLCSKCGEAFHFMCELEYHAKQHLKQKGYKCDCGRTFFQYTDLLYHRHPDEDGPAPPPMPEYVPPPTMQRSTTLPAEEFPTPDFKGKGYEPKYQVKQYSDVRSRPYICQYCSKSYPDSRGLAYHMYSHRGERHFNPRASRYLMCRNDNSYISPGVPL